MVLLSYANFFCYQNLPLKKTSFMNDIGPGLGPNYLHRLPADGKTGLQIRVRN